MKFSRPFVTLLFAGTLLAAILIYPQFASGQTPAAESIPDWQKAAGSKMVFDVASIKQNKSGGKSYSNVPFSPGDSYAPTGGLFTATNWALGTYIGFAYKLTGSQFQSLTPQLPKWAFIDRFDIQGRVEGNPSKDQMRLMVQSLLADRFKLAIHYETRQLPVFELILLKPGKTGPRLQPHSDASPCLAPALPSVPAAPPPPAATVSGGFPAICGQLMSLVSAPGRLGAGARNATMGLIVTSLNGIDGLDRPILDRTGLGGTFDFSIEFTPQFKGPPPPGFEPDPSAPTFFEALQDQLGLKLVPQTGPVDVLVIDHVEEPSAN